MTDVTKTGFPKVRNTVRSYRRQTVQGWLCSWGKKKEEEEEEEISRKSIVEKGADKIVNHILS